MKLVKDKNLETLIKRHFGIFKPDFTLQKVFKLGASGAVVVFVPPTPRNRVQSQAVAQVSCQRRVCIPNIPHKKITVIVIG